MDDSLDLAQATIIAKVIEDNSIAGDVFSRIRIEDLDGQYRAMAEAIHGLRLAGKPCDVLSLIDEMTKRGTIGRIGGPAEIHRVHSHWFGSWEYSVQIVSRVARLRRLERIGLRVTGLSGAQDADPHVLAQKVLEEAQSIVDSIEAEGDITTPTIGELLSQEDEPYDWVIPGLLERGDRLVLTGSEGLGKSMLQRQLAVSAASGVHPLNHTDIPPVRVLYVDCENGPKKIKRSMRSLVHVGKMRGHDPSGRILVEAIPEGLDLTKPEDEAWLVSRVAGLQPDLLFIGPIYRLHAGNPNDEEEARKVTRVLDRCRLASNCALVTEGHAGHGPQDQNRPVRPTGSSLWLRWPEFGYGLRAADGFHPQDNRVVDFVAWRGDREEREWPSRLRGGGVWPWMQDGVQTHGVSA